LERKLDTLQLIHTAMWGQEEYIRRQQIILDDLEILNPRPKEEKDEEILANWEFIRLSAKKRPAVRTGETKAKV